MKKPGKLDSLVKRGKYIKSERLFLDSVTMPAIETKDGTEIYYKDWGTVNPSSSATDGR